MHYHLEWLIELRLIYKLVEFVGQDDKAKIPLGNRVAVSTGVCRSGSSIVPAGGGQKMLRAMDHDFGYANLTPSVTLRCNIPNNMSGFFLVAVLMGLVKSFSHCVIQSLMVQEYLITVLNCVIPFCAVI